MIDIEDRLTFDERSNIDYILALRRRWADTVYPALVEEYRRDGAPARTVEEASGRIVTESGPAEHPLREQWEAALARETG